MSPRVGRDWVRVGGPSLHSMSTPSPGGPGGLVAETLQVAGGGAESCQRANIQSALVHEAPRGTPRRATWAGEETVRLACPAGAQGGPEPSGLALSLLFLTVA